MKNNRKCERCSIFNCEQLFRFHCYFFMRLVLLNSNWFKAWAHITVKLMRQALTYNRRLFLFVTLYQISEINQRYQWRYHCYTHFKKNFFIVVIRMWFINIYIVNERSATKRSNIFSKNLNNHSDELSNRINNFLKKFNHLQKFERSHKCR